MASHKKNRQDFKWITDEMFYEALEDIAFNHGVAFLLSIEGAYEPVKEYYNNAVLEKLANETDHCPTCGSHLINEGPDAGECPWCI